jgi:hypothetical protein
MQSGHGWSCGWLDPVAFDPERTFAVIFAMMDNTTVAQQ